MNITSIFRQFDAFKESREVSGIGHLNARLKDRFRAGLRLVLAAILLYASFTLFTIYNLLVSL